MKQLLYGLVALGAFCANAQGIVVHESDIAGKTDLVAIADVSVNGNPESILTDNHGMSLYTFEKDSNGISNCSGACLKEWPPMHVPLGKMVLAPFGVIKGNDGQSQLTLNGLPLYHYNDDEKPGDAFGQYPQWDVIQVKN